MWRRLKLPTRRPASLRPFMFFSVASAAVTTRVLSLSYQTTADGVSAGSLAVWGDWSAHLAYAGSFAYGDNRGFDLPIASGHGFRYHFLSDFFGAMFTVSGANLQQGLVISEWLIAVAFAPLLWCATTQLTRSRSTAALTLCLFTLSGGLGLWYFAQDVERSGWSIITALPRTYARIPDEHIWLDNTISASLYAQRSTLLGLSVGLAALILVLVSRPSWSKRGLASAGILIGLLGLRPRPYVAHGHGARRNGSRGRPTAGVALVPRPGGDSRPPRRRRAAARDGTRSAGWSAGAPSPPTSHGRGSGCATLACSCRCSPG